MPERRFRTVVADDHAMVRAGLRTLLGRIAGVEVIAEATNGLEAISQAKEKQPDLLMLDIAMPFAKGIEVVSEVRRWSPATKIVVYTGFTSTGLMREVVTANVEGLFPKSGPEAELAAAIPLILAGGRVISKSIEARLARLDAVPNLTGREMQILSMIANGLSNGEIGHALNISPKTVDNHRTNLMRKLGVHTVAQLMAYALREGLLDSAKQL